MWLFCALHYTIVQHGFESHAFVEHGSEVLLHSGPVPELPNCVHQYCQWHTGRFKGKWKIKSGQMIEWSAIWLALEEDGQYNKALKDLTSSW